MSKKLRKMRTWSVSLESVYVFGREERLQAAYEEALPQDKFKIGRTVNDANDKGRPLRAGIKRKTGTGKDD
jgi:hypothetical protein